MGLGKDQPKLILFCGLPGSGKTTLAKRLANETGYIRLCTDDWFAQLGIGYDNVQAHESLQACLYAHCKELVGRGLSVIWEDGLWTRVERAQKRADAHALGVPTVLHYFDLTFDELWYRLEKRNAQRMHGAFPIQREQLEQYWSVFERPDEKELQLFDAYRIYR